MKRATILCTLVFTACGGSVGTMEMESMAPPPVTSGAAPSADALANRAFAFTDPTVFGVGSALELRIGALAASPPSGPFTVVSLGNSDEASGTITLDPCTFDVKASSFPANARLVAGAKLMFACAADATGLRVTDPVSKQTSEGELVVPGASRDPG